MSDVFVGVVKETIESKVDEPAKVTVEFALDTDDVAVAKSFLNKINDLKDRVNKEVEYNKIPESSRRGARYLSNLNEQ